MADEKKAPTLEETIADEFVRSQRPSYHFSSGSLPSGLEVAASDLRDAVVKLLLGYPAAQKRAKDKLEADAKAAAEAKKADADKAALDAERDAYLRDHPGKPLPKRLEEPKAPEGGTN